MSETTYLNSTKVLHVLVSDVESVQIIKTGWLDDYHVIRELGETGESFYSRMKPDQIKKRYDIDIEKLIPS